MSTVDVSSPGKSSSAVATYKILIIGDSNVGKTSLLNRYTENSFQGSLISTVGKVSALEVVEQGRGG